MSSRQPRSRGLLKNWDEPRFKRASRWMPALLAVAMSLPHAFPQALLGQSVLERTPNLSGGWVGNPHDLQFNFLHRFYTGDAPPRKVFNTPTFLTAYSLPGRVMLGVHYASNSAVAPRLPNEWEIFGRWAALSTKAGHPLDGAITVGYNEAARSVDGEATLAVDAARLRFIGAVRTFSDGYGTGDARVAFGGGGALRLSDHIALAGDVMALTDRRPGEDVAWGAAIQIRVPLTPHTLSLQITNTSSGTLQGSSVGTSTTRQGFEFTIPLTLSRFLSRDRPAQSENDPTNVEVSTVVVVMQDLQFGMTEIVIPAGSRVVWVNRDPVAHTSTADGGEWDSGLIGPGESWGMTYDQPGEFPFHCTPHPFMTGRVVVR